MGRNTLLPVLYIRMKFSWIFRVQQAGTAGCADSFCITLEAWEIKLNLANAKDRLSSY